MDLNRVQLIGNVTREVEIKNTPTGKTVASFSVATNQQWKDAQGNVQKRAEFHNIVAWGKLAEICHQYVTKGMRIFAEGGLQTRQWESQDAQKHTRTEIILENMIMLSQRPRAQEGAAQSPTGGLQPPTGPVVDPQGYTGGQDIKLEDIPF